MAILKPGDKFNAYTKIRPHLAIGCPCTFVRSGRKSANAYYDVYATCKDLSEDPGEDCKRIFSATDFNFEVLAENRV